MKRSLIEECVEMMRREDSLWLAESQDSPDDMDAEYLDAVEHGDMDAAFRMVREAAARAMPNTKIVAKDGLPLVMHHFTKSKDDFFVFNHAGGAGIYFTSSPKYWMVDSRWYRKLGSGFYLNAENGMQKHDAFDKYPGYGGNPRRVTIEQMKADGLDHWFDTPEFDEVAVFSPLQIKSAAAVTHDDEGNVIPLSQRFDMDNPDIRH